MSLEPATIVAQIAPQRSTQYTKLAQTLAPHELLLSPVGGDILGQIQEVNLGGQNYLRFDLPTLPTPKQLYHLGTLATLSAFFLYHPQIGEHPGPFLAPLTPTFAPKFPPDLAITRRYRGKTNELFTHFLCNIAKFSSRFAHQPWKELQILDPLMGGGTTLFTGLVLGADVAGIEQSAPDVKSTVAFLRQYMRDQAIACEIKEERLRQLGLRWRCTVGRRPRKNHPKQESPQQSIFVCGDTLDAQRLLNGFRPHLIIADLPYGVQHRGDLFHLLENALPVWTRILRSGGAIVFAWDATRLSREKVIAAVSIHKALYVQNNAPYDQLAHQVDRVIKRRDLLLLLHR